jgi:hypothetical protein
MIFVSEVVVQEKGKNLSRLPLFGAIFSTGMVGSYGFLWHDHLAGPQKGPSTM